MTNKSIPSWPNTDGEISTSQSVEGKRRTPPYRYKDHGEPANGVEQILAENKRQIERINQLETQRDQLVDTNAFRAANQNPGQEASEMATAALVLMNIRNRERTLASNRVLLEARDIIKRLQTEKEVLKRAIKNPRLFPKYGCEKSLTELEERTLEMLQRWEEETASMAS